MINSLEDFKIYGLALKFGEEVWRIVNKWNYFKRDTVGKQLVRSVDSIAANLSEGLGRYHYLETKNFTYYARGSLFEAKTWLTKAHNRKLFSDKDYHDLMNTVNTLGIKINNYINSLRSK